MNTGKSIVAHWQGGFDENRLSKWAKEMRKRLSTNVAFGTVYMSPRFFPYAEEVLDIFRINAQIPLLVGCSSNSVIANESEIEEDAGIVLGLYSLPESVVKAVRLTEKDLKDAYGKNYWYKKTCINPEETNGWLVFSEPFQFDTEEWTKHWNFAYPGIPAAGGVASGNLHQREVQLYLDGKVYTDGCVVVSFGGNVALEVFVSQGATPIGDSWVITRAEKNLIIEIANAPAYNVLAYTFSELPSQEQLRAPGNILIGLAVNDTREELNRGDFIIRNLIGGDPETGILAIGGYPRTGQIIQFQYRDAATASQDLLETLHKAKSIVHTKEIYGTQLFCCTGRGKDLFGELSHDAKMVQKVLGPLPVSGFFCNGEIAPVNKVNYLHGYSAVLAFFVKKSQQAM